jgi:hypothetical protein
MMTYLTNELNAMPNEEFSIGIQSITHKYVDRSKLSKFLRNQQIYFSLTINSTKISKEVYFIFN